MYDRRTATARSWVATNNKKHYLSRLDQRCISEPWNACKYVCSYINQLGASPRKPFPLNNTEGMELLKADNQFTCSLFLGYRNLDMVKKVKFRYHECSMIMTQMLKMCRLDSRIVQRKKSLGAIIFISAASRKQLSRPERIHRAVPEADGFGLLWSQTPPSQPGRSTAHSSHPD